MAHRLGQSRVDRGLADTNDDDGTIADLNEIELLQVVRRGRRHIEWNGEEKAAASFDVLDVQGAADQVCQPTRDRQPEATTGMVPVAGSVAAERGVEDSFELGRKYPTALVIDSDSPLLAERRSCSHLEVHEFGELTWRERFGEVVVCPLCKAEDPIVLLAAFPLEIVGHHIEELDIVVDHEDA